MIMMIMMSILSHVVCPSLLYHTTLSHKRQVFREKVIEYELCVSILSAIRVEIFLI